MSKYNNKYIEGKPGRNGRDGEIGPPGRQGEQGPRGYLGPPGPRGDQGIRGDRGIQGLPGERGQRGEKGERGDIGCQGPMGYPGLPGPQGRRGPSGGERGEKGEMGPPGPVSNNFKEQFNFYLDTKLLWDGSSVANFKNEWFDTNNNNNLSLRQSIIEDVNFFPTLSCNYEQLFLKNVSIFGRAFILGNIKKISNISGCIFNNTFKTEIEIEHNVSENKLYIKFIPQITDYNLEIVNIGEVEMNLDGSNITFKNDLSNIQVDNNFLILDLNNLPTIVNKTLIFCIKNYEIKVNNSQINWESTYTNNDGILNFTWNNYENKIIKYDWINEDDLELIIYSHCGYMNKTQEVVKFNTNNSNILCTNTNLLNNLTIGYNRSLSVKVNKISLKNLNNLNIQIDKFDEINIYLNINLCVLGANF